MAAPLWFQKIARQGRAEGINPRQGQAARDWYRQKALQVRGVDAKRLMQGTPSRLFARGGPEDVGSMLCFFYKAKHAATLPYWDEFPLIFPISFDGDSFLSINLHYLPPVLRARLMDQLYTLAVTEDDKIKRLALSYQVLNGAARFAPFKPCIKRHLFSQVRSKFFFVQVYEWDMALMLPTQRFIGATTDVVWRDSRRIIRNA